MEQTTKKIQTATPIVLFLFLQIAGITWWASKINANFEATQKELINLSVKIDEKTSGVVSRREMEQTCNLFDNRISSLEQRTKIDIKYLSDAMNSLESKLDKISDKLDYFLFRSESKVRK